MPRRKLYPVLRRMQAAYVLDDAALLQHAPALAKQLALAQAAVAAIPERPVTRSYLTVEPAPAPEDFADGFLGALARVWVVEVGSSLLRVEDCLWKPPVHGCPAPCSQCSNWCLYIAPLSPYPLYALQPPAGVSCTQAAQLQAWLPPGGSSDPGAWEEVYRSSIHGFGAAAFHARCDGRGRLLVLVRARDGGWLFGGFTAVGFSPGRLSYGDHAAFLFSLTNSLGQPEKLESQQWGMGKEIFYFPSSSASFGHCAGLHICSDADSVSASCTCTGYTYAQSVSVGAHPMARGMQVWFAAEVIAWVV